MLSQGGYTASHNNCSSLSVHCELDATVVTSLNMLKLWKNTSLSVVNVSLLGKKISFLLTLQGSVVELNILH